MGYAGNYADTISDENIKKFCPKEYQALMDSMVGIAPIADLTLDELARQIDYDELENENVGKAFDVLVKAFRKKTGLDLGIGFHDSENNGDRYDEIDGHYFFADGVYQLTKAGKKMQKYVERKTFVTYG